MILKNNSRDVHFPVDMPGQWSYVWFISKGNQARLRENKPMFKIGQTVEVPGKGHGKVTAINMRGGKVKSYDVALENGNSGRFVFVSAPVEFASPDQNAFNKPLNRDYYGDQARMFARSHIG